MEAEATTLLPPAASLGALLPALPPGFASSQVFFQELSCWDHNWFWREGEGAIPSASSGSAWSELRVWISGRQQLLGFGPANWGSPLPHLLGKDVLAGPGQCCWVQKCSHQSRPPSSVITDPALSCSP